MSQTRDELAAEILESVIEAHKNRSPREIARDKRSSDHRHASAHFTERERIVANMRHTHAFYQAIMVRQRAISVIDTLTEDDKDELAQTHLDLADCPYLQPPDVRLSFLGNCPDHYQAFLQEFLWDMLWWADYLGKPLDTYLATCDVWGPVTRAAVHASPPMPDGYVVSTRR